MKRKCEFQNFTYFAQDNSEFVIKNDVINALSEDLSRNFSNRSNLQDIKLFKGRDEHFSYKPILLGERLLVRTGRRGGLISFLKGLYFAKHRPFEELRIAEILRALNIDTPEIVAVKIWRVFGFFYKYIVVMKEIQGAEDLALYLSKYNYEKKAVLENVALALSNLHRNGIFHSDLNLKNILIAKENGKLKVYFVDLDKSWRSAHLGNAAKLKNIARLNRSYEKLFSKNKLLMLRDKINFLMAYGITMGDIRYAIASCQRWLWFHRIIWVIKGV